MKHIWRMSGAAFALFALSLGMRGQQDNGTGAGAGLQARLEGLQSEDSVLTLHAATHLVVLDVVATDKKGHTVPGLAQDGFHILEDGRPQAVKFFEEHAPVDPALIAKQREELAASLPANTFTSYEPFANNAITVLLLNKLTSLPDYDVEPLRLRMLDVILSAPRETLFAIYQLDSQLRLIQPVTRNRDLLVEAVNHMWQDPTFGVSAEGLLLTDPEPGRQPPYSVVVDARRAVFTEAMNQLSDALEPMDGRKTIFSFTGGLRCNLSSEPMCSLGGPQLKRYLCDVMDLLEQSRISMYRTYPNGDVIYGFGCNDSKAAVRDIFDKNFHYYTLYYAPSNQDWNGKYRKVAVTSPDRNLRLSYRGGYYGLATNAMARGGTATAEIPPPATSLTPDSNSSVPSSPADGAGVTPPESPSPSPVIFTVKVDPADAPGPGLLTMGHPQADDPDEAHGVSYRNYTLRFFVAAAGLKIARELTVTPSSSKPPYSTRLEITAVSYLRGRSADAKTIEVTANFDGPADPRITKGEVMANLTVRVPEKGKRLLQVVVRDVFSGRLSRMDIPVDRIVLPKP